MKPNGHHEEMMRHALALARRGEGLTRPNPPVGAVVVAKGRVIGTGFHPRAGAPHAEIFALRAAGARARGATLYVTLEPCSTQGRTPPCTDAIRAAGIREVVVATRDPNPRHAGRGLRLLRRAGLRVVEGVGAPEARALLAPFAKWITTARPHVTLKLGISLDGRISDMRGHSKWITGPEAREQTQALRRRADAIIVGARTVALDNPHLLPRPDEGRRPYRVIVSSRGAIPPRTHVLTDADADRTIVAVTRLCPIAQRKKIGRHGARVWVLPAAGGQPSLKALMRKLGSLGVLHVLCEGGGELAASLIAAGLVDDFHFFIAPCLLGGPSGNAGVRGRGWRLDRRPRLTFTHIGTVGDDLSVRAVAWGTQKG